MSLGPWFRASGLEQTKKEDSVPPGVGVSSKTVTSSCLRLDSKNLHAGCATPQHVFVLKKPHKRDALCPRESPTSLAELVQCCFTPCQSRFPRQDPQKAAGRHTLLRGKVETALWPPE